MPAEGTPNSKRELAFHQSNDFIGFRCRGCDWTTPLKRYWAKGEEPPKEVKQQFDAHTCKQED